MTEAVFSKNVSVIIPVFNEAEHIADCLRAVCNQSYSGGSIEVIVVDNGSTDDTVKIASGFNVRIIQKPTGKIGAIRNFGVSQSTGDILAFIDGDCIAGNDWIKGAVLSLQNSSIGAVGGGFLLRGNPTWVEKGWCPATICENKEVRSLATGSFILLRNVFYDVGGFDENINAGEDTKFSHLIREKGFSLFLIEECFVIHLGYPQSILSFMRRQFWHSSSYFQSNKGLADRMFISVILFSLSVVSALFFCLTGFIVYLFGTIFILISPIMFAFKVFSNLPKKYYKPAIIFRSLLVYYLYYLARSAGLVFSAIDTFLGFLHRFK